MQKVRPLRLAALLLAVACSMSSCKTLKNFLSQDLEDEDFIIGQLYADEYVDETPFVAVKQQSQQKTSSGTSLGIDITAKDNSKLYQAVESWYGTPYQYGGCSKSGVDCSCFVGSVFKSVYGIKLQRVASDMQKDVTLIPRSKLREGDLVFFTNSNGKVSHVGIYLKEDMFVHSSTSRGVMISKLSSDYWNTHFYKGGRHKNVTTKY
ncbi:MAG: C40 family peptidase [Bacteroidales bacterium]|nr:C40 family peptidase [Bacteroidales bacterium]